MSNTIPLTQYLFTRLHQLGVRSVHGVPSDYNLQALDYIQPSGLHWVGNANELNAGYAADGYARIKGLSALFTGFGVGELSAINAMGGSYSEKVPVVHIVGTPLRAAQDAGVCVHHTLGDGNYRVFAEMYEKLTVAQANLNDPLTACALIDATLRECILQSGPVYIELPTDMVSVQVSGEGLSTPIDLEVPANDPETEEAIITQVLERIYAAKQPHIIVDGFCSSYGYREEANALVRATGFPTSAAIFGKGVIDEQQNSNFYGIYAGMFGNQAFHAWAQSCDLVLRLGPLDSDTNTYGFTIVPAPEIRIDFHGHSVDMGGKKAGLDKNGKVHVKSLLQKLLCQLNQSRLPQYESPLNQLKSPETAVALSSLKQDGLITQDIFWKRMSSFFRPGDIILTETGTAYTGGGEFQLPTNTILVNSSLWLSIGYMLGACCGSALALREMVAENQRPAGRTILFEGDGSLQMTAQAISDMIRNRLDVVIFVLNNDGYTIERLIHGMTESYNDVQPWRYLEAPNYFGAPRDDPNYPVTTSQAANWGELEKVMSDEKIQRGKGLTIVELMMLKEDGPEALKNLAAFVAKRNRSTNSSTA
ncbi:hypothetical protein BP6252_14078 [Coleophoma cylindrospora]|uniref:Pyruvate decarboxylase n=1 Tax=Coleophoma cylindrospora TaxID=1849047 RepID=A0A3D8Q400_9HELO|nr:hypothetical protein BP6252_14078 [Coleophoma cylindrospora]